MQQIQLRLRFVMLVFGVFFGSVSQAQIIDDQEYIQVDKEVVDTDTICGFVAQYINEEKAELKVENQELAYMLANVGKNVQNETQRTLLNRVYANYIAKISGPRLDGSSLPTLGASVLFAVISSSSADRLKKNVDTGIINKKFVEEIKALNDTVSKQIEDYETDLKNIRSSAFDYLENEDSMPIKTVTVEEQNPYYRPNYASSSDDLDIIDLLQQTVGWEWVQEEESKYKTEDYPYSVYYQYYESHPEYRVRGWYQGDRSQIYDSTGHLVRINKFLREHSLQEQVTRLLSIRDFNNNKYDIKSEGSAVNLAVKYELGILKKPSTKAQNAAAKSVVRAMWNRSGARASGSYRAEQRAKRAEEIALLKTMSAFKMSPAETKASHYVSQLEHDYEGKFRSPYKIERLDDTSFKVIYIDENGDNFCTVKVAFYNTDRFMTDFKLSLLPNDTAHVNLPKEQIARKPLSLGD